MAVRGTQAGLTYLAQDWVVFCSAPRHIPERWKALMQGYILRGVQIKGTESKEDQPSQMSARIDFFCQLVYDILSPTYE